MPVCKICFSDIKKTSLHYFCKPKICQNCFNEFDPKLKTFKEEGISYTYVYEYDDVIRKLLFQLKGCYDIELGEVFLERFKFELRLKYHDYILVPLPSNPNDDEERGFNHVIEIFKALSLPFSRCIYKKINFKQSDLAYKERIKIKDKLGIVNGEELKGKLVLIVDDVITSGSSIKGAISLIKPYAPKKIKVLVLARNTHLINKKSKFKFSLFSSKNK